MRELKRYARLVFRDSLVTGVSNIVTADGLGPKFFKTSVFLACLCGFLYQSATFVTYILTYPTVVDIDIVKPDVVQVPAYTFCNNNPLRRSAFCDKYPHRCELWPECGYNHSHFCGDKEMPLLVPKEEFYQAEKHLSPEELVELGTNAAAFVVSIISSSEDDSEGVEGPRLLVKGDTDEPLVCYSKFSRVDSSLLPVTDKIEKIALKRKPVAILLLDVEPEETFHPFVQPGVLFSVHSPFEADNPFLKGMFLKPGRTYIVHVEMEEERLLPYPYDTDCLNYTQRWLQHNRSGPRMQEMCQHLCYLGYSLAAYNCVSPAVLYPSKEPLCKPGHLANDSEKEEARLQSCLETCKDDCSKVKYRYQVEERYVYEPNGKSSKASNHIRVEIYVDSSELVQLQHRPQYQEVEVFSYIGGFMGCWLGISLVAVADFFESLFHIIRYFFKKRSLPNENGPDQ